MAKQLISPYEALTRFADRVRATAITTTEPEQSQYGFRVGEFGFLISPDALSEIVLSTPVYPIPNTVQWLQGLINLRGNLVPVYDFLGIFELDITLKQPTLLILDQAENGVGMMIDGLPRPVSLNKPLRQLPNLPQVVKDHVSQGYLDQDSVWLTFNHMSFFKSLSTQIAI